MIRRIFSLICAAALALGLAACAQPEREEAGSLPQASESAPVEETQREPSAPNAPLPDDAELAGIVTVLRSVDPTTSNVVWDTGDGYAGVRVTRELLGGIADLLATEPFEKAAEVTYGAMYTDGGVAVGYVAEAMPEGYASLSLDIYLLSDNEENGQDAGKMRLSFDGSDGERVQYVFEPASYRALESLLEDFRSSGEAVFQGDHALVQDTSAEAYDYSYPRFCIQEGGQLIVVWDPSDGADMSILSVLDAATGDRTGRVDLHGQVQRLEKMGGGDYSYRLVLRDSVQYWKGVLEIGYEYIVPAAVSEALWAEDDNPFDVDIDADVLAYTAEDGVYLAAADGSGARLVLDNADIEAIIADMETPDHDSSLLHYVNPVLLEGGKKLAATVHMLTDGNFEPANYAVTVVDVESGEATHYPGFLAWLATPARRLDDATLLAFGGDGMNLLNVSTGALRMVELDWYADNSFDYSTFVRVGDATRNAEGEKVYEISMFTIGDGGDRSEPQTLLTVQADYVGVRHVTEDYVLCSYSMEGGDAQSYVIVPLP